MVKSRRAGSNAHLETRRSETCAVNDQDATYMLAANSQIQHHLLAEVEAGHGSAARGVEVGEA